MLPQHHVTHASRRRSRIALMSAAAASLSMMAGCGGAGPAARGKAAEAPAPAPAAPASTLATAGVRTVGVGEFATALAGPAPRRLIDLRTPEEYGGGHLANAELIDFYAAGFADRIAALDRSLPLAIYCRSGNRSGQTARQMRALGFSDVLELGGGIVAWTASGRPVRT